MRILSGIPSSRNQSAIVGKACGLQENARPSRKCLKKNWLLPREPSPVTSKSRAVGRLREQTEKRYHQVTIGFLEYQGGSGDRNGCSGTAGSAHSWPPGGSGGLRPLEKKRAHLSTSSLPFRGFPAGLLSFSPSRIVGAQPETREGLTEVLDE